MKNFIKVKLDNEHCFNCTGEILARQNENRATALKLCLTDEMLDKWVYIEFTKPDGTKVSTPKLEIDILNKQVIYEITNALTDQVGEIKVEIVIRDTDNLIWKSFIKKYLIVESTNASAEVEKENPDFITEAQKVVEEANNIDINVNKIENITKVQITRKDGTVKEEVIDYILTDEDKAEVKEEVEIDIQPILENIENVAKQAEVIARGKSDSVVKDTWAEMEQWLKDIANKGTHKTGDNLYIKAKYKDETMTERQPDYWITEALEEPNEKGYYYEISELEADKPDLDAYAKKEQFVTLTQTEYDALEVKSANTYYFIIEEE